jgi:aspartate 1-decarboxylase
MLLTILKSKIHRATVTDANLNYVGSITIDKTLMHAANIREWEKVAVVNINNGERFETYVIEGQAGSGEICINGAAARKAAPGDLVIIIAYALCTESEADSLKPAIVQVDAKNHQIEI